MDFVKKKFRWAHGGVLGSWELAKTKGGPNDGGVGGDWRVEKVLKGDV